MLGELMLPVSAYSAIKKDGVPMYVRARKAAEKGEVVSEVPVRKMVVFEAELLAYTPHIHDGKNRLHAQVRFVVSSGTYVRSLVEEVGRRLGYPAVMSDLRRTRVGQFELTQAQSLEDF
jgi:tRNA pseudouridine55 synthase